MSITPQGKSVQSLYRDYREGKLLVNRAYQRKLVWSLDEKRRLIDSILRGFPIPLILLAERPDIYGGGKYEIIDGIQRFNAIFTFIENAFKFEDKYFDVREFARAKQLADEGAFEPQSKGPFLSRSECANILDYQLAITVYPAQDEMNITEVFGRINSGGRRLSAQEQRQAGVTSEFSRFVRSLSAEVRGDVSKDVVLLTDMPEISVETARESHGYGVRAEETIWCKQGILSVAQLKDSEDEQFVADFAASILLEQPLAASKELFDKLYDGSTTEAKDLEARLIAYGAPRLAREIKFTLSTLKDVVECKSERPNFLRDTVRPGHPYPIKAPFYAIFMAFFDLVVRQQKSPEDHERIVRAMENLSDKLETGRHYETTENRTANINTTKGLVQDSFIAKEPPVLGHGPSLAIDFENSLRRSRIETPLYELKQGILRIEKDRVLDTRLLERLVQTACAISNIGPDSDGYIFVGVADKAEDAQKIEKLDGINPRRVAAHYVVGVDREACVLNISLEQYVKKIVSVFQASQLSDPLKTQLLGRLDTISFHELTVVRIVVPRQKKMSFVGEKAYCRVGSSTEEVTGQKLVGISKLFPS